MRLRHDWATPYDGDRLCWCCPSEELCDMLDRVIAWGNGLRRYPPREARDLGFITQREYEAFIAVALRDSSTGVRSVTIPLREAAA